MSRAARRKAYGRGRRAERLCAWLLRLKGYRILARDYRTPVGEIDLIVRRGGIVVAVEVKARADLATALEAVRPRQRRRIERALSHFVATNSPLGELMLRFDVMVVVPRRVPSHIMDAWRPDSK